MKKNELQKNDILIFKNNHTAVFDSSKIYVIEQNYDEELNCLTNDDYSIIRIYRPHYELIFGEPKIKRKVK